MRIFMFNRRVTTPTGYAERSCVLVSYTLPFLKHCFALCAETSLAHAQTERADTLIFFLAEAERLAQRAVGDSQAFLLVHSGSTVRKRPNWHLHVFVIQHRWQKAWLYTILGMKSFVLVLASSFGRRLTRRQAPAHLIERALSGLQPSGAPRVKG